MGQIFRKNCCYIRCDGENRSDTNRCIKGDEHRNQTMRFCWQWDCVDSARWRQVKCHQSKQNLKWRGWGHTGRPLSHDWPGYLIWYTDYTCTIPYLCDTNTRMNWLWWIGRNYMHKSSRIRNVTITLAALFCDVCNLLSSFFRRP